MKIRKSHIFAFILGAIIFGSIGVFANITASNITYNGTTVDLALDDLYTKKDQKIIFNTFGTPLSTYSQGNGSGSRTATLQDLDIGKYIVTVYYGHGGASSTDNNLNTHEATNGDLVCENNNCIVTQLEGYNNIYRSTDYITGQYRGLISGFYGIYYLEITQDDTDVSFSSLFSNMNSKWAQFIDISAIPISQSN